MATLNIILHEPEIPGNTGNIGRTCVATGTRLHLIEPLGFRLNDKTIKRAGMDYWNQLDVTRYDDWNDFLERNPGAKIYFATTKRENMCTPMLHLNRIVLSCLERERRDSGRNSGGTSGTVYPHSNDWRDKIAEFIEFSGNCFI